MKLPVVTLLMVILLILQGINLYFSFATVDISGIILSGTIAFIALFVLYTSIERK